MEKVEDGQVGVGIGRGVKMANRITIKDKTQVVLKLVIQSALSLANVEKTTPGEPNTVDEVHLNFCSTWMGRLDTQRVVRKEMSEQVLHLLMK